MKIFIFIVWKFGISLSSKVKQDNDELADFQECDCLDKSEKSYKKVEECEDYCKVLR